MKRYSRELVVRVRNLRSHGKTYGEILAKLNIKIPKSTLSDLVQGVVLPSNYEKKIAKLNVTNLDRGRKKAVIINKIKREEFLDGLTKKNLPISKKIKDKEIAKIALAMLCLGEASRTRGTFSLGSSDPRIITLFIELLKKCFTFDLEKIRCTVQCRADQNIKSLETYWRNVTGIPKRLFYKGRVDPRTKGKKTIKKSYKGVLRVDYFNTKIQIDLESLAQLLYNQVS